MRLIYLIILLLLLAGIAVFALQNRGEITLNYLDRSLSCPTSLMIGVVYVVGMVSGSTVVGFIQRSVRRVSERPA